MERISETIVPRTDSLNQSVEGALSITSDLNIDTFDASDNLDILFNVPDVDLLSSIQPLFPLTQESLEVSLGPVSGSFSSKEKSNQVTEVYQKALGHFDPEWRHYRATEEKYLSLALTSPWTDDELGHFESYEGHDKLPPSARDQILVMVVDICEPENVSNIISTFPNAEILDRLLRSFLAGHAQELDSWIHIPTFRAGETWTGLLAACVAAGALREPRDDVRRFGLAIYDILQLYLFKSVSPRLSVYTIRLANTEFIP